MIIKQYCQVEAREEGGAICPYGEPDCTPEDPCSLCVEDEEQECR